MEVLRFLFISILVLYIIRSIARLLFPMLFQRSHVVNKAQQSRVSSSNIVVKDALKGK